MANDTAPPDTPPSPVERIKENSDGLRGGISTGLADDTTGALHEDDTALIKFHGIYQQDDRDLRDERARRKLEADYSFMLRLRIPGGLLSAAQWLAMQEAATALTSAGSLRLTTRQTLQFHGIPKDNLRPLLHACHKQLLDSIAACGDVNRNVMCSPHAARSPAHRHAHDTAAAISEKLLPATRAYYEIWLGEERLAGAGGNGAAGGNGDSEDPLYGRHYLPRKFKIGIAVPPQNDVDIYSQDIGFIAVTEDGAENGKLCGFNVLAGGGLGTTHGDAATYPRLASEIGTCTAAQAVEVAWHIAAWQRDNGNRSERKQARLKYTIDRRGLEVFQRELAQRLGYALPPPSSSFPSYAQQLTQRGDALGWQQRADGLWDYGLFIENGRIASASPLHHALHEIARQNLCEFIMTPNQNLMLIGLTDEGRNAADAALGEVPSRIPSSPLREHAMACVALPTCPLAMAEAERYLPALVTLLEAELAAVNLEKNAITIRMTGCPNGCARPYLAEIGLVGKAPGRYNLYLGAAANGERLGSMVAENMNEKMLLEKLRPLFAAYAKERRQGESFGDFSYRTVVNT